MIRAIEPLYGLELMAQRRSDSLLARRARIAAKAPGSASILLKPRDLCRGPARLCEALAINRQQDGWDLTLGRDLWIEADPTFQLPPRQIARSPRIGISTAQQRLLRFYVAASVFVSGRRS